MRLLVYVELFLLFILLVAAGIFQAINPLFLSLENIAVILRSSAFTGICAIGITFLLISGMIDVSIGSIAGLVSVIFAGVMVRGVPLVPSVIIGLAAGGLCGYINSILVLKFRISAFLATISTLYIYRGIAMTVTQGYTIYPIPETAQLFGKAEPLGISWPFFVFIACIVIGEIVLNCTVWGLTVRATGSDREAATCNEVNVNTVNMQVFILCGVMAALSGLLLTMRVQAGQPTMGQGWELNAIAASAIGGVSLFGYTGSMAGILLGVLLIQVLTNGLVSIGMSAYIQPIQVGVILAAIAGIDTRRRESLNL